MSKDKAWKDKILEPPAFVNIANFTDATLDVIISGKTQPSQQWSVTGEMRQRLLKALKENDIHLAHLPLGGGALLPK